MTPGRSCPCKAGVYGMEIQEMKLRADARGCLLIPAQVLQEMGLRPGDEIYAAYAVDGSGRNRWKEFLLTGELILIKRGESGYYHSVWSTDSKEENIELADFYNERLGVTPAQRQAMEVGSMLGWDLPGADPHKYEDCREQFEPEPQNPEDSGPVMSM